MDVLIGAVGTLVGIVGALVLWRLHAIEIKLDKHIQYHLEKVD